MLDPPNDTLGIHTVDDLFTEKVFFSPEGARLQALQPPAVASNPTVDDVARIGVFGAGQYVRAALWRGSRQ